MKYSKPKVVAQNATEGSYAAGCPAKGQAGVGSGTCRSCERSGQYSTLVMLVVPPAR